jgi:transaldolase
LKIKVFADGADLNTILDYYNDPAISGFTTNPSLMKKDGVKNYKEFAKKILENVKLKPVSFEVISDNFNEMQRQALEISSWGGNVYVKIPITNTQKVSSLPLIKWLSEHGIKINVTAITTLSQVLHVSETLKNTTISIISVFAGRIADTGIDPVLIMEESAEIIRRFPLQQLLWASTREVYNLVQAENCGCDIITMTPEIIKKIPLLGKSLDEYSLETVQMFYNDAVNSGYTL